ncbi:PRC-barrel domain-containing protein [Hyphomicrobium sp.]|uniref:PRC-barrel domain-containing protein n=1 Tax=Hyphomicrobium sp. TaxID=82 RepID=UPI000F9FA974|nr:PRC-barrel domain-containing protein [Hyphomicrobium sp.]RUP00565.1 MAG: photosynthetic reaction center subunit H [Hyphomicrobium sp.]
MKGQITQNIDVAQVVLYTFWAFFAYLIFWLRREDKREGYPLEFERPETAPYLNFPPIPSPKKFFLANGEVVLAPRGAERREPEIRAEPIAPWPGAPLEPTGDPMSSFAGPGAYALRADVPDVALDGLPRIVPLRVASTERPVHHDLPRVETADGEASTEYKHFELDPNDPDPRGMEIIGADGLSGGIVADVWIDISEVIIRYLEIQPKGGSRNVLVPITFTRIDGRKGAVYVNAVLSTQFLNAPTTRDPQKVTLREEDRICGYYGGGLLYATPRRREALL